MTRLFLDADLSILGHKPEIYDDYAKRIRQEYAHISHEDYCRGRAKVLRSLTEKPRIFFSSLFYDVFEEQARLNTQREIGVLENLKVI